MKNLSKNLFITSFLAIVCLATLTWNWQSVEAQTKPLTYPDIITALNAKLPVQFKSKSQFITWLISQIKERKIDKPLTADREDDLRQAGATNELIEAIRQNSPQIPKPTPNPTPVPTPVPTPTPALSPPHTNLLALAKSLMKYSVVAPFTEGMAGVRIGDEQTGKYGFINNTGQEIIPLKYDDIDRFTEGVAPVSLDEKWGYIDKNGKEVISSKYSRAQSFSDGLALVRIGDYETGKWGFLDKTGREVIPLKFNNADSFSENLAPVKNEENSPYIFIDKTGKQAISQKFTDAYAFSEGLALVQIGDKKNGKWGFIDKTGKEIIQPKYVEADSFFEGLATVAISINSKNKWGYIDKTGREITQPKYDEVNIFWGGLGAVRIGDDKTGKWGAIDKTGREIIPLKYDEIWCYALNEQGLLGIILNGKKGFADIYGNEYWFENETAALQKPTSTPTPKPDTTSFIKKANELRDKGDYELSIKEYDQAITADRDNIDALVNRGMAYHYMGNSDLAFWNYKLALELKPGKDVEDSLKCLLYDYLQDNHDEAIKICDRAIALQAKLSLLYFKKGNAFSAKYNYEQAIVEYSKSIEIKPDLFIAYNSRGSMYDWLKDYNRAIADFQKSLQINPNYQMAKENLNKVLKKKK